MVGAGLGCVAVGSEERMDDERGKLEEHSVSAFATAPSDRFGDSTFVGAKKGAGDTLAFGNELALPLSIGIS